MRILEQVNQIRRSIKSEHTTSRWDWLIALWSDWYKNNQTVQRHLYSPQMKIPFRIPTPKQRQHANLPSNPFPSSHQYPIQIHHQLDPLFQEDTKFLPEQPIRPTTCACTTIKEPKAPPPQTSTGVPQVVPIQCLGPHTHQPPPTWPKPQHLQQANRQKEETP
jgi:hypothetical protein